MILAALLLAATQATKAETLAGLYGETLGAASSCADLPHDRLDVVTKLAAAHLKSEADKPKAEAVLSNRLADGIERGRRAIGTGGETCAQALSEFDDLERDLKR